MKIAVMIVILVLKGELVVEKVSFIKLSFKVKVKHEIKALFMFFFKEE